IYAGVIIYEMLSGAHPFYSISSYEMTNNIRNYSGIAGIEKDISAAKYNYKKNDEYRSNTSDGYDGYLGVYFNDGNFRQRKDQNNEKRRWQMEKNIIDNVDEQFNNKKGLHSKEKDKQEQWDGNNYKLLNVSRCSSRSSSSEANIMTISRSSNNLLKQQSQSTSSSTSSGQFTPNNPSQNSSHQHISSNNHRTSNSHKQMKSFNDDNSRRVLNSQIDECFYVKPLSNYIPDTLRNLVYWMLEEDSALRPSAKQLLKQPELKPFLDELNKDIEKEEEKKKKEENKKINEQKQQEEKERIKQEKLKEKEKEKLDKLNEKNKDKQEQEQKEKIEREEQLEKERKIKEEKEKERRIKEE
ncbi:MAG: hypothetical protein EZS28_045836, partial [Streblomastix strix]